MNAHPQIQPRHEGITVSGHEIHINKMTIRFWPRTNSLPSDSIQAPLYCQVRVNGLRTSDFSIGVLVPIKYWNQKQQEVQGHPLANELNNSIFRHKRKLLQIKEELEESGTLLTADSIRVAYINYTKIIKMKALQSHQNKKPIMLFSELLNRVLEFKKQQKCAKNTLKNYHSYNNNWHQFLKKESKLKLPAESVNYSILDDFREFLNIKNSKKVSESHISNHYLMAKKALDIGLRQGHITTNPISSIELKYKSNFDPDGLEPSDIEKLIMCKQYSPREQSVVYAFLWMCSTGMDYCDYSPLDWSLELDSGKYWVSYPRQKNQHRTYQPNAVPFVLDFGLEIWKKFDRDVSKFPVMSLVEMNRVIKIAAKKAGINFKGLTTKRARKTYANICANDVGLSNEALMYLMGHTTTKHLRAYRKIKRRRVLAELKNGQQHHPFLL